MLNNMIYNPLSIILLGFPYLRSVYRCRPREPKACE